MIDASSMLAWQYAKRNFSSVLQALFMYCGCAACDMVAMMAVTGRAVQNGQFFATSLRQDIDD